jgi:hypothetical protein
MDLNILDLQLDEGRKSDLYSRVRELRALNNSGKEIVTKVAKEFGREYSQIEKMLLPFKFKNIDNMSDEEIAKLRTEYRSLFPARSVSKMSDSTFIDQLKDKIIARGR